MFNKVFTTALVLAFVAGMSNLSFAMMCGTGSHQKMAQSSAENEDNTKDTAQQTAPEKAVDAGNQICPVSDEKIDEKTKIIYEYGGKIYNFCCKACVKDFNKNPQKYIDKLEEAEKEEANEHEGHSGHHHE